MKLVSLFIASLQIITLSQAFAIEPVTEPKLVVPEPIYTQEFGITIPFSNCGFPGYPPEISEFIHPKIGVRTQLQCNVDNFWNTELGKEVRKLRHEGRIDWLGVDEKQGYPYYAKAYISAGDGPNFQTLTIDIESRKLYKKELDSMIKQDGIRVRSRYTGPFPKGE